MRGHDDHLRDRLAAIASAAMPRGERLPGAGEAVADRMIDLLRTFPPSLRAGYLGALGALDAAAMLRGARAFGRLDRAARLALLGSLRAGPYPERLALRGLLHPLKTLHCEAPEIQAILGVRREPPPLRVPPPRGHHTTAAELTDDPIECDVVVIGSGAGGAVVAWSLARQGLAVALVEEGELHTRDRFTGSAFELQRLLWRDAGLTGSIGNVVIPIPIGRGVGGTTLINSGTCLRPPPRIQARWRRELGIDLGADHLDPYLDRVSTILGVSEPDPAHLGPIPSLIAEGCDALGWKGHRALPRNAPGCEGRGMCVFGCPTDAKRSTNVSFVPMALAAGAHLFTGLTAERVVISGGRATGIVGRASTGRAVEIRARAVVVACGALLSPLLLERSGAGHRSGELGKTLTIHPVVASWGLFDRPIEGWRGVPQSYLIDEHHDEGILFQGAFAPLEICGPLFTEVGPRWTRIIEQFDRLACFGFMIEDSTTGRVRAGPGGRPIVTYSLTEHDVARMRRGVGLLARVYFAAGARRVMPVVHGFDDLTSEGDVGRLLRARVRASDFDVTAYHPLGTCRMGRDPSRSVIGLDHRVHDVGGLYVTDGAAVPTSVGVNPQLTIMAMALRASEHITRALGERGT